MDIVQLVHLGVELDEADEDLVAQADVRIFDLLKNLHDQHQISFFRAAVKQSGQELLVRFDLLLLHLPDQLICSFCLLGLDLALRQRGERD